MLPESILSTTGAVGGAGAATSNKAIGASKDQFLKLLMAQLKNQDPLQAPDVDKIAEQITQFGQLEQLMNLNTSMETMAKAQTANRQGSAVGMIGSTVELDSNKLAIQAGKPSTLGFFLPNTAKEVNVEVVDSLGRTVRTVNFGAQNEGSSFYEFDGLNDDGTTLPEGNYSFRVNAKTVNGVPMQAYSLVRGQVTSVDFYQDEPVFRVDGQSYTMDKIISVKG